MVFQFWPRRVYEKCLRLHYELIDHISFTALCGLLFPGKEEAGYSNFKLWEATGSVITYAYSPYLCSNVKLYILIGLLSIGMLCYLIIEYTGGVKKVEVRKKPEFELVAAS